MRAKEKLINEMIEKTNSGEYKWERNEVPSSEDTKRDQYLLTPKDAEEGWQYVLTFVSNKLHEWIDLRLDTLTSGEIVTSTFGESLDNQPLLQLWKRVAKVR